MLISLVVLYQHWMHTIVSSNWKYQSNGNKINLHMEWLNLREAGQDVMVLLTYGMVQMVCVNDLCVCWCVQKQLLDQMDWEEWFHKPGMPPFKPKCVFFVVNISKCLYNAVNAVSGIWSSNRLQHNCAFYSCDFMCLLCSENAKFSIIHLHYCLQFSNDC